MEKLIGLKKVRTAVFISGAGSNLEKLIKFSFLKKSPIKIVLVVSSTIKAKGLSFSKKYKIKRKIYSYKNKKNPENLILNDLENNRIEFICLAGFMKILSSKFIKSFKGAILNIHPSLLPKYKGLNTHERALNQKEKFAGCTVHYVNSKLDSGKIILQKKVKILKKDTVLTLKKRVLKQEHILYPKAINKLFANS